MFLQLLAAGGRIFSGLAANSAGNQAKRTLDGQAREARNAGAAQELRVRDTARKAIGEQLAAQFSNGMLGGTGSALDALTESQVNAALDAMMVRRDAEMRGQSLEAEGRMRQSEGRMALVGSVIGAGNALHGMDADWAAVRRGQSGQASNSGGGFYDPKVTAGAGLVDPGPEMRARYPLVKW